MTFIREQVPVTKSLILVNQQFFLELDTFNVRNKSDYKYS